MHNIDVKEFNSGMPTATVRHKSERNSTHRGDFKKGYILTVKVEKMDLPLFEWKSILTMKKQFVLS